MLRLKYIRYWIVWKLTHWGKLYGGCEPACFNEWLDNEYQYELEAKAL